jgi:DNA-binding NarL/FixJ family response regulator
VRKRLAGRTILIADDHRLFAEGLASLLHDEKGKTVIVTELAQVPVVLGTLDPDLLILDLAFGQESAIPLLRQLRVELPELPILVISASEEVVIVERVRETGAAYLAKSRAGADVTTVVKQLLAGKYHRPPQRPPRLRTAVSEVIGGVRLSHAHIDVLRLLRQGHSNSEIATLLGRAIKTVEAHVSEIYSRTGLGSRGRLMRWANENARALRGPRDGR